ncbi:hypothetical protein C5167_008800 [Papaver somniferum]|uniref:Uncharacterized protein n=1 Tax=Papaver somniferum TaxID=3469 RepID=A0A4Y7JZI2_PAPSO|nr:hypothetical protein C5167_008800 [Papaver somniferum]
MSSSQEKIESNLHNDMLLDFANLLTQEKSSSTININNYFPGSKLNHNKCLVLKIIANKSLQTTSVREILQKFWKTNHAFYVSVFTDDTFLIKSESRADTDMIMDGIPWIIKEDRYDLERCTLGKLPCDYKFDSVEFGLQIHRLPVENLSAMFVHEFVSQIGETRPVPVYEETT